MSGGGKGGSTTSSVQIPAWAEQAAQRNIQRADQISQVGYVPYYGPDVAAFSPMQEASFAGTNAAAQAFGLPTAQGSLTGMNAPQDFGGVRGYSSAPLYEQSLASLQSARPNQYAAMTSMFVNPYAQPTGGGYVPPASPFGSLITPTAQADVDRRVAAPRGNGGDAMEALDTNIPSAAPSYDPAELERMMGNVPNDASPEYRSEYEKQMARLLQAEAQGGGLTMYGADTWQGGALAGPGTPGGQMISPTPRQPDPGIVTSTLPPLPQFDQGNDNGTPPVTVPNYVPGGFFDYTDALSGNVNPVSNFEFDEISLGATPPPEIQGPFLPTPVQDSFQPFVDTTPPTIPELFGTFQGPFLPAPAQPPKEKNDDPGMTFGTPMSPSDFSAADMPPPREEKSSKKSACVVATHAVESGAFTPAMKREAVVWCMNVLHGKWWGEAIRRGYRYLGTKKIEQGKAHEHYAEFRRYVEFASGKRRTLRGAATFAARTVQFFFVGLVHKEY